MTTIDTASGRGRPAGRVRPRAAASLLAAATLLAGGLLAASARGGDGGPGRADAAPVVAGHHHHGSSAQRPPVARVAAFRAAMRVLWEDHVTWTRMVVVDVAAGLPDLPVAEERLLRNQADIGDAVAGFFGRPAGDALTALLRDHILIAADILTAARAGDADAVAAASARWDANAVAIADLLSSANPASWPRDEMRSMMREHLALTTAEALARIGGDWEGDVRAYDAVHRQALAMADILSTGIVRRFPERFAR